MSAVALLVRSGFRRRWRGLIVLALLVGFAGAVTLGAAAGATRSATSYGRFLESTRTQDVLVFAQDVSPADVAQLRSLPDVAGVGHARQLALVRPDGDFLAVGGAVDDTLFRDVNRLRLVRGRDTAPGATDEVVLGEPLAEASHLGVGDTLAVRSFTQAQVDNGDAAVDGAVPAGPDVQLRVVGISRSPLDLSLQGLAGGVLLLPRPFVDAYGGDIGNFSGRSGGVLFVRLADGGAGVDRFLAQLGEVLGDRPFEVDPAALSEGGVQDSIDLLAIGIAAFGAVAGIAGLIAVSLIISREVALLASGQRAVSDLGLLRSRRAIAIASPVTIALAAGGVVAVLGAWAASPLMPFGIAGRAEPDPGPQFDTLTLGAGALAGAVVLGGVTAVASWRRTRTRRSDDRTLRNPPAVSRVLEETGLTPPTVIGVSMALESGRGETSLPVRSSLAGTAIAVLGVTAATVFGASLGGLRESPSVYGANWDVIVNDVQSQPTAAEPRCGSTNTSLSDDRDIDALANACTLSITLDGRALGAVGLTSVRGSIEPTMVAGRAPEGIDEVALGWQTMDALSLRIGDQVVGRTPAGALDYRVVGVVVVPSIGDPQAIADGAVFTGDGLRRLEVPGSLTGTSALVVRFHGDVDRTEASRNIERTATEASGGSGVLRPAVPLEVERLREVDRLPMALGAFLAILGIVAIGHLLFTSVQRRHRDFAILKSLGFRRGQIYRTVFTQATTVALVGLLVGLALGIVAGSALWDATAEAMGVPAVVEIPLLGLVGITVVTLTIANSVAALAARAAARTKPAAVLRVE